MSINTSVMGTLFGTGLLGRSMTGLVRIPTFLTGLAAASMAGELAIRGLSSVAGCVFNVKKNSWVEKIADSINGSGIRPYKDPVQYPATVLAVKMVALAAFAIIANEAISYLGGTAPGIYNDVLTFLGPIRIDTGSYLTNVHVVITKLRTLVNCAM